MIYVYDRFGHRIAVGTYLLDPAGRRYRVQKIDWLTMMLDVRKTAGPRRRVALSLDDLGGATGWRVIQATDGS